MGGEADRAQKACKEMFTRTVDRIVFGWVESVK